MNRNPNQPNQNQQNKNQNPNQQNRNPNQSQNKKQNQENDSDDSDPSHRKNRFISQLSNSSAKSNDMTSNGRHSCKKGLSRNSSSRNNDPNGGYATQAITRPDSRNKWNVAIPSTDSVIDAREFVNENHK